jgi:hypothetical protein
VFTDRQADAGYNAFWIDPGSEYGRVNGEWRSSWIVEPANGVYGTQGTASMNPFRVYKKMDEQFIDLTPSQTDSALTAFKKSYQNELKSFIGAVKGLNPVFSSGDEALSRMKVVDAMYQSSKQKSEIKIPPGHRNSTGPLRRPPLRLPIVPMQRRRRETRSPRRTSETA